MEPDQERYELPASLAQRPGEGKVAWGKRIMAVLKAQGGEGHQYNQTGNFLG